MLSFQNEKNPQIKRSRVAIDGVLLLDKPVGWSSNDALIKSKRLLNAKKAGHTGTLDPFATGLLPLCFGEATKFSYDLLGADKTYEATVHLGITTDTGDTEGNIINTRPVNLLEQKIINVVAKFIGPQLQIPHMFSALKIDGKPLYEYARSGITLERDARNIMIHELSILSYKSPFLKLRVTCSKGTYIRVLGEDIGRVLGCGAHLNALRRIKVGNLHIDDAVLLSSFEQKTILQRLELLKSVDALLSEFEGILLSDELAKRFLHGQRLSLQKEVGFPQFSLGRKRIYRKSDGKLLGSAFLQDFQILVPERLIATHF